jgi:Zn-dependent protease
MNNTLYQAAALIIPLIFAIVFHEVAHGWVARMLGDTTAADLNRLSLNPLRHVDPVGTVLLPGVLKLMGLPVFGWAKPVPVNKWRLRNPKRDMMLVGAAGPGMNLVMGVVGAVLLGLLLRTYGTAQEPGGLAGFIAANLMNFLLINVFLALFNLLPIPPFDGSHIVEGLLPAEAAQAYGRLRRYGFTLILLLLVVLPSFFPGFNPVGQLVVPPVQWLTQHYLALAAAVAGA